MRLCHHGIRLLLHHSLREGQGLDGRVTTLLMTEESRLLLCGRDWSGKLGQNDEVVVVVVVDDYMRWRVFGDGKESGLMVQGNTS